MARIQISQIERIADLFDDRIPRTSKMVSKELAIKNGSTSKHISTLRQMGILEVIGKYTCPLSNFTTDYYTCVLWKKRKG
jgi:Mn-dependent DtxR family transcriptional regulator